MKTHMLSKASLTFFPLVERKLDLKHTDLSRRRRQAECWKYWQAGEKLPGSVWRKQSLLQSVCVESPDHTLSWLWCQTHVGHKCCPRGTVEIFIRNCFCRLLAVQGICQTPSEKISNRHPIINYLPCSRWAEVPVCQDLYITHTSTHTHAEELFFYTILGGNGVNKATDKIHK